MITKQDLFDAEDAWTDACENFGNDSDAAQLAWTEYQDLLAESAAQDEDEPNWDDED